MPKKNIEFDVPMNILMSSEMKLHLIAIAYFRGSGGHFAGPARDMIADGIRRFESGLSDSDRKRYEDIMANVRTSADYRRSLSRS